MEQLSQKNQMIQTLYDFKCESYQNTKLNDENLLIDEDYVRIHMEHNDAS